MITEEILNQAKDRLVTRFHPQRIILFGRRPGGQQISRVMWIS